jgi:c-di-GMP-related signal transduction protein
MQRSIDTIMRDKKLFFNFSTVKIIHEFVCIRNDKNLIISLLKNININQSYFILNLNLK